MFPRMMFFLCCLLSLCTARADDNDPAMAIDQYRQHYVVASDGSYHVTVDHTKLLREQRAVQEHGQYYIAYNRTLDTIDAIDAHTAKADGRRVPVLPEHIKDQQESASSDAPMFQDTRVKIIVFPDLGIGDRLVVRYVLRRHTPLFPGHFADLSTSAFHANPQFQLIYDLPDTLPLYADARGFVAEPVASAAGRKRYQWRYLDGPNPRAEAGSVSYLDYGKRLAVSTFSGYPALARAYAARAGPQAQRTPAIAELAARLVSGMSEPRARALALSDWVRTHIRYVGVYVGPGGVVPHAAATVLANRYGDCKDHVVLLEALLRAVGIDSSAALVNSGNAYALPATPTLGVFNHVITWVPALDLFLDSTAEAIQAGFLPSAVMGKQALIVDDGTLRRTPSRQFEHQRTEARFDVDSAGKGNFKVTSIVEGALAEPYRRSLGDIKEGERKRFVEELLHGAGQQGEGVLEMGALAGKHGVFSMRMRGSSDNVVALPGPAALPSTISLWGGLADSLAVFWQERARTQDFVCPAISAEDDTAFHFPPEVNVIALPPPLAVRDANFDYSASYEQGPGSVTVKRRLHFQHSGMVCSADDFRRMRPLIERMQRDLKSQIIVGR
jgi:transglutaminase-like putative cysteine protease